MLDIELFRTNPSAIKASQLKRGLPTAPVDWVIDLDAQWRTNLQKLEQLKHSRNEASEHINKLKKAGKPIATEIKKVKKIVLDIERLGAKASELKAKRDSLLLEIPNILAQDVLVGKSAADNKEIKKVGKPHQCQNHKAKY